MKSLINIKLLGPIPSKKNTWKRGVMGMYIPAGPAKQIADLLWQLKKHRPKKPIEKNVKVKINLYTHTLRQDASNVAETLLDLLQKAEILKNDRQVHDLEVHRVRGAEDISFIEIAI